MGRQIPGKTRTWVCPAQPGVHSGGREPRPQRGGQQRAWERWGGGRGPQSEGGKQGYSLRRWGWGRQSDGQEQPGGGGGLKRQRCQMKGGAARPRKGAGGRGRREMEAVTSDGAGEGGGSWPGGAGAQHGPARPAGPAPSDSAAATLRPTTRSVLPRGTGRINGVQDKEIQEIICLVVMSAMGRDQQAGRASSQNGPGWQAQPPTAPGPRGWDLGHLPEPGPGKVGSGEGMVRTCSGAGREESWVPPSRLRISAG